MSIIVPTRDAPELLTSCVATILDNTDYPSLELLIVDNGTREPRALAQLEALEEDERVGILRDPSPFNFSALNNRAVRAARGELIALMNNDVEVSDEGWLRELVSQAIRPEIGCVGPKLLYPDGTIQHAGVVLGLHGVAGHPYKHMSAHHPGYFGRLAVPHTVSAVTAACLVVKRGLYEQVGGLDEELAVAFNDVDFCIKVQQTGHRNLFVPTTHLVHHESASRGADTRGEKRERFQREAKLLKARWGRLLHEDPHYSPHLSLDHEDYSIRVVR